MSKDSILVINCGSSSLKFSVINPATEEESINGLAERMGSSEAVLRWKINGEKGSQALGQAAHDQAIEGLMGLLREEGLIDRIAAIGHRVVHGGEKFTQSALVTDEVIAAIEDCIPLAPLHNPAHLLGIKAAQKFFPGLPNAVVFDTAFHQTMAAETYLYAIPYELYEKHGVRRYGAHGTSYRYVGQAAADMLGLDINNSSIMVAHLGNGASACAIKNGKSIDTTMGLTPLEGLVMGTRSGDIDPNLFNFLNKSLGYSLERTTEMLNKESGLLGLSGMDSDCRVIEDAAQEGNKRAQLTLDVFCHVLAEKLAGFAAAMGSVDALVFTGGIGENSSIIRKNVIERLSIFGFKLHEQKNDETFRGKSGVITEEGSTVAMVVATNEELMIARDTQALTA
ncbi:acetate kinase [Endozoicomonas montiporae]|uniref:Acetate kinase n=2 Tax=Endozoicomonas montiporae TaxID=1027273 RepID=A0A081N8R0_9GAMM|nr:acetate kinase [Endozoicomonas montiporae]AMO55261.1 acetate kinase [Endozoicomonas montiporae CL-33]KEQ14833.1 acetate kinase [Endozoicomonas montiporae]